MFRISWHMCDFDRINNFWDEQYSLFWRNLTVIYKLLISFKFVVIAIKNYIIKRKKIRKGPRLSRMVLNIYAMSISLLTHELHRPLEVIMKPMTLDRKASVHVIWVKSYWTYKNKFMSKHEFRIVANVKKSTASSSQVPKNRVSDLNECTTSMALEM